MYIIKTMEKNYEYVDHPNHYNNYSVECIEMLIKIYGKKEVASWCEMNAFKYRMRAGVKPGISIEQDFKKETWYLNKAKELRENG